MKKILAILMSAALLLGILAGCTAEPPATSSTTEPSTEAVTPLAAGMLVLNAEASFNISYDADGLVLEIENADDSGFVVLEDYENYLGKPCAEAVCDLIAGSVTSGFLTAESTYIVIKQAIGSSLPGSTFLETIVKDAEEALAAAQINAKVMLVVEENLDENGYINLETAKQLALAYLSLDSFDSLDGTASPIDGEYCFAITSGSLESTLIIDAVTGDVYEGELEGVFDDEELEDEELEDEELEDEPIDIPTDEGEDD